MSLINFAKGKLNNWKEQVKRKILIALLPIILKVGIPLLIVLIVIMVITGSGGIEDTSAEENNSEDGYTNLEGDSFELCKQWIRSFEGHEGLSDDGTQYKIGLVGNNRTVGYGVDLDAGRS